MGAETDFSGLDEAETFAPDLPAGKHVLSIVSNDVFHFIGTQPRTGYNPAADTHMTITGTVESTDSPDVKVGSRYRAKISYLTSRQYPDSQKGLKLLRTYLAAALDVPSDKPPPADVAPSWTVLAQTVTADPGAMDGDRVMVLATLAKNPKYCNYDFSPAPAVD